MHARQARRAAGAGRGAPTAGACGCCATSASTASPAATATTASRRPPIWDGTEAARKLLSTVYRVQQHSGISFGAGHVMDVLRGKVTDKVTQFGHERAVHLRHRRGVQRAAVARRAAPADRRSAHLQSTATFNTLQLTDSARAVLKGEVAVHAARVARGARAAAPRRERGRRRAPPAAAALQPRSTTRPSALRRAEGLARRGRARAQPAGLRHLPRRHAGAIAALAPRRSTTCRASAASARRSSRPTGARSCGGAGSGRGLTRRPGRGGSCGCAQDDTPYDAGHP